jgi:hypothetical protein
MSLPESLANINDSGCGMLARVSRELARMEKRKLGIVDDCVDGWCDRKLRLADSDFPIGLPQTRSPALRTLGPTRSACWPRGSASHRFVQPQSIRTKILTTPGKV